MAKIVAIVTKAQELVRGGGAPIFVEQDDRRREETAFLLEKIMNAAAHDLKNGSYVLVDHASE